MLPDRRAGGGNRAREDRGGYDGEQTEGISRQQAGGKPGRRQAEPDGDPSAGSSLCPRQKAEVMDASRQKYRTVLFAQVAIYPEIYRFLSESTEKPDDSQLQS